MIAAGVALRDWMMGWAYRIGCRIGRWLGMDA